LRCIQGIAGYSLLLGVQCLPRSNYGDHGNYRNYRNYRNYYRDHHGSRYNRLGTLPLLLLISLSGTAARVPCFLIIVRHLEGISL